MDRVVPQSNDHAPRLPSDLKSPYVSRGELLQLIAAIGLENNRLVDAALKQAEASHGKQIREGGAPYLEEHVFAVTKSVISNQIAAGRVVTSELVASALTHDVPEDDPHMPSDRFRQVFGLYSSDSSDGKTNIADIVGPLTKPDWNNFPGQTKEEKKAARDEEYFRGLTAGRPEVAMIKVADRENNMLSALSR